MSVVEKITNLVHTNLNSILNSFDEPEAIVVSIVWPKEYGSSLPAGHLIVRNKGSATVALFQNCITQNVRICEYLMSGLKQAVQEAFLQNKELVEKHAKSVQPPEKESHDGKETTRPNDTSSAVSSTGRSEHPA